MIISIHKHVQYIYQKIKQMQEIQTSQPPLNPSVGIGLSPGGISQYL